MDMFYFDSKTTVPLQWAALVFLESLCWQDVVWLTVPWDPNIFSFQTLIKLTASGSMNVYKEDFAMLKKPFEIMWSCIF